MAKTVKNLNKWDMLLADLLLNNESSEFLNILYQDCKKLHLYKKKLKNIIGFSSINNLEELRKNSQNPYKSFLYYLK